MGKSSSKILAVLLVTLMAAISVAGREGHMMPAAVRPAGCHQHGAKPPASVPVSYRCCQNGHDSAILQTSRAAQVSSTLLATGDVMPAPVTIAIQVWVQSLKILSPDPPHTIPLRV
jgi:hypothetical protein